MMPAGNNLAKSLERFLMTSGLVSLTNQYYANIGVRKASLDKNRTQHLDHGSKKQLWKTFEVDIYIWKLLIMKH